MKESHPKEIKMTKMAKAKGNALNVDIQIISSENAQNYQETIIKEPSLEDHGVITKKMKKSSPSLRLINIRPSNYGSSSHHEDDDEDEGTSRASTPSSFTYLNSLRPLNYQRYDIPTSSQQDDDLLFERQTTLHNQTQQIMMKLEVDSNHSERHCEESSGRKRNKDVE
ncbi:hypothetical protein Tco_0738525 [Tanacetum coccineum]